MTNYPGRVMWRGWGGEGDETMDWVQDTPFNDYSLEIGPWHFYVWRNPGHNGYRGHIQFEEKLILSLDVHQQMNTPQDVQHTLAPFVTLAKTWQEWAAATTQEQPQP